MGMEMIDAEEKYFSQMEELCKECFGSGYLSYPRFLEMIKNEAPFKMVQRNGELIGYSVFETTNAEEVAEQYQMELKSVAEIAGERKIYRYKSAAVKKSFHRKGIAGSLLKACIQESKEQGCGSVFVAGWKYHGQVPMHHILIQNGFTEAGLRKNLWYEEEGYTCIICGGRCKCDGVIYYLKLE